MNIRNFFAYLCLTVALFSIAGMRKNEDPIAATAQTSPISLKQKLEETKDGVKGAPSPSMTFYGSQPVLTGSPVKEEAKEDFVEEEEPSAPQEDKLFEEDEPGEVESG